MWQGHWEWVWIEMHRSDEGGLDGSVGNVLVEVGRASSFFNALLLGVRQLLDVAIHGVLWDVSKLEARGRPIGSR